MGYGWPDLGDPVLSDCDIDALAVSFAWVLEEESHTRLKQARTTAPWISPAEIGSAPGAT